MDANKDIPFYENEYAQYWIDGGIVFQVLKDSGFKEINVDMAVEITNGRQSFTKKKPVLLLVDVSYSSSKRIDVAAMKYFVLPASTQDVLASVICIDSYLQYAVAKFFLRFYRRQIPFPVEVVKSRREGVVWLQQFM